MHRHFVPKEPLTQVVFVHDYIQLVFQEFRLNLYNTCKIEAASRTVNQGELEFAGLLVRLIGKHLRTVDSSPHSILDLQFEDETFLKVLSDKTLNPSEEAFEFVSESGIWIVENNS